MQRSRCWNKELAQPYYRKRRARTLQFLYWYITPLYVATLASLIFTTTLKTRHIEKPAYIVLSILWGLAALIRPWGVSPDDINYEGHFFRTGPLSEDQFENVLGFSYLYYLVLSAVRDIFNSLTAFLIISSVFLMMKMQLIGRATNYSLASLFIYVSIFFMLHDVVQFRVGAASFFYLLAIYLLVQGKYIKSTASYVASIFFHSQAAIAPIVLACEKILSRRYWLAILLTLFTQVLAQFDLTPTDSVLSILNFEDDSRLLNTLEQNEGGTGFRLTSVAIIIFLFLAIKSLRRHGEEYPLLRYAFYSAVAGFFVYWATASVGGVSNRLMQFMWVPLVFLGPFMRKDMIFYLGGISICICFFLLSGWVNGLMSFA